MRGGILIGRGERAQLSYGGRDDFESEIDFRFGGVAA
jgi:hypothetical protein